jgi:hypothetical protein
MKRAIWTVLLVMLVPLTVNAEVVKLADGRSVDLKSDGTYEFVESVSQIRIEASGCKNHFSVEEKKDDFKKVVGYKYFTGFSIQYRIVNETDYPLVVRKLGTEYSKDYGMFYTLLKTPTFADPIEKGGSLIMKRDSHLFYTMSKDKLTDGKVKELEATYGCSIQNFDGQTIVIDTGHTKMKFPPDAGNLNPLDLLTVSSEVEGLEFKVR